MFDDGQDFDDQRVVKRPYKKINAKPIDPAKAADWRDYHLERGNWLVDGNGCWVWQLSLNEKGYGKTRFDGGDFKAYRVSWVASTGRDIKPGYTLDHKCRNRACIFPHHMEEVLQGENLLAEGATTFTKKQADTTHCPEAHPLVAGNLVVSQAKRGKRKCRTCGRAKSAGQAAYIKAAREDLGMKKRDYTAEHGQGLAAACKILGHAEAQSIYDQAKQESLIRGEVELVQAGLMRITEVRVTRRLMVAAILDGAL